jgi:hypothetical protein
MHALVEGTGVWGLGFSREDAEDAETLLQDSVFSKRCVLGLGVEFPPGPFAIFLSAVESSSKIVIASPGALA